MTKVYVPYGVLLAANVCASTEATRYCLNGVYVVRDAQSLYVVSTDGHRLFEWSADTRIEPGNLRRVPQAYMAAMSGTYGYDGDAGVSGVIVPSLLIKQVGSLVKVALRKSAWACLEIEDGGCIKLSLLDDRLTVLASLNGKSVDGTFPDWKRVLPPEIPSDVPDDKIVGLTKQPAFNADYVADWAVVGDHLGCDHKGATVLRQGRSSAKFDEVRGVWVMDRASPCRWHINNYDTTTLILMPMRM